MDNEKQIKTHLRNIKFNADKWEIYVREVYVLKNKIKGLEQDLKVAESNTRTYSKKTRGLARLEII